MTGEARLPLSLFGGGNSMMKIYKCADGFARRFEEGTQPPDAILIERKGKAAETKNKAKKPANKSKKVAAK